MPMMAALFYGSVLLDGSALDGSVLLDGSALERKREQK